MKHDFNKMVDRRGSNCLKYDFTAERGRKEDVLPLWIADMDFQTAPCVIKRLSEVAAHGIYGYSEGKADYFQAVADWYQSHFQWQVERRWLVKTPGIVFSLAAAIRAYTREGESVLLQQPVYYPFSEVIQDNNRKLINNPLKLVNGRYEIDFEDFEAKIIRHEVKLFLFCTPHNPVGRVWQEWELRKIGDICLKHQVFIVSDEIHSDFTYDGHKHLMLASLSPKYADITVTCTSPSKTFNLAGLQISNNFISNSDLRRRFRSAVAAAGYSQPNLMGLAACQAAYEEGDEWLIQLKEYLAGNMNFVKKFLEEYIPEITLIEPEGTYLLWLDFRALNMTEKEREDLVHDQAGLWLDSGAMFGEDGMGFERINIASPRSVIQQALDQLKEAVAKIS